MILCNVVIQSNLRNKTKWSFKIGDCLLKVTSWTCLSVFVFILRMSYGSVRYDFRTCNYMLIIMNEKKWRYFIGCIGKNGKCFKPKEIYKDGCLKYECKPGGQFKQTTFGKWRITFQTFTSIRTGQFWWEKHLHFRYL